MWIIVYNSLVFFSDQLILNKRFTHVLKSFKVFYLLKAVLDMLAEPLISSFVHRYPYYPRSKWLVDQNSTKKKLHPDNNALWTKMPPGP